MKLRLIALVVALSAFVLTPFAKADSIVFESHTGNDYTYDLQIDNSNVAFILDGFSITGLSGVTNAELGGQLASLFGSPLGGITFDSNSVAVGTAFGFKGSKNDPFSIGTLTITSAALAGDADFSILDSNGLFCGTVTGPTDPIAPTPEPSSLVLLGSGLLAAAGAMRRKLFA